ncbi:MAG: bifunctional riboflavin kinase/FAD synthetase [Alphaproteobacteria bacterium]|nr:bifunctional riboflavin kinase/FAD synthetase [Alphaproteobacteria bacterium]
MRIVRSLEKPPADARGAAVALGNFDGVHRGHQAVIDAARVAAAKLEVPLGVLTFEPHSRQFFRPDAPPFRITPFRAKVLRLAALGVDLAYVGRFNRRLSLLPAEKFVDDVLARGLGVRHVAVGEDFIFGHRRLGNPKLLRELGARAGFNVTVVGTVGAAAAVKSSRVRTLLSDGVPLAAAEILGDWWRVAGVVRRGNARGRRLGYPTANLRLGDMLRPRFGVYAVRVRIENEAPLRAGVASVGVRPTFDGDQPLFEAHLFDFSGDLYSRQLCVDVVEFLRPEMKFADVAALRRAMDEDAARARAILADPDYAPDRFRAGAA